MKKNTFIRKSPKGVTLIELTVVIAVILTLLSVLFVGASYYKNNADKAACVINQSAIEKASQSMENISGSRAADFAATHATGAPLNGNIPTCPAGGTYSVGASASSADCDVAASGSIPDHSAF